MTIRIARHTSNLELITEFYTKVIGLEILGSFQDHDGYNGVFLGKAGLSWHLEFTQSAQPPRHIFDEDDLLVFYPETAEAYEAMLRRMKDQHVQSLPAKNPYWNANGILLKDPDGYGVVLSGLRASK